MKKIMTLVFSLGLLVGAPSAMAAESCMMAEDRVICTTGASYGCHKLGGTWVCE